MHKRPVVPLHIWCLEFRRHALGDLLVRTEAWVQERREEISSYACRAFQCTSRRLCQSIRRDFVRNRVIFCLSASRGQWIARQACSKLCDPAGRSSTKIDPLLRRYLESSKKKKSRADSSLAFRFPFTRKFNNSLSSVPFPTNKKLWAAPSTKLDLFIFLFLSKLYFRCCSYLKNEYLCNFIHEQNISVILSKTG